MKNLIKTMLREGLNNKLRYYHRHLDSYSGQDNYQLELSLGDDLVGLAEYVLYDGEITISDINVRPELRRKGIGSRMIQSIKDEHPEDKYVPSMKTDLGAKFKHKDVSSNMDHLNENIYDDNLERLFHGQSKVRTRNIFAKPNPHGTSYNSDFQEIVNSVQDQIENPTNAHKERVNLEDIAPTQRFISLNNLERVSDVSRDTNAILILVNGIYYAIDGHHRIVNRILGGDSFIIGYVIKPEINR